MLSILGRGTRLCDGITRRETLRVGGLGFIGLLWSDWLRARASGRALRGSFGKAKACILIFNYGGPSHLDTFDLKPDAPREVRGDFRPIATSVPGTRISEHLPRLAALAHRYAILRSIGHRDNDHAIGAYLALTGHSHPKNAILGIEPPATPQDMPSMGSVVSKLRGAAVPLLPYVTLGDLRHFGNNDSLGQDAGCLGKIHDPFTVPFVRPLTGALDRQAVESLWAGADRGRCELRRKLLGRIDRPAAGREATRGEKNLDDFTRKAYDLLASAAGRDAFDLTKEPQAVRDSYGPAPFAQNCLLARRLVEAGVPMITVYSVGNRDWDTHGNNFNALKNTLLPDTDRGVSALLRDLHGRGLLESTLVVWMGDMGRTPRINKDAGRDHWSFCYSILLAGAGIRGGLVHGSSDRTAAYPASSPVSPVEVAATIYHLLGIDPSTDVTDQQGRPFVLSAGRPIRGVLG
jgi:hypothetical protein